MRPPDHHRYGNSRAKYKIISIELHGTTFTRCSHLILGWTQNVDYSITGTAVDSGTRFIEDNQNFELYNHTYFKVQQWYRNLHPPRCWILPRLLLRQVQHFPFKIFTCQLFYLMSLSGHFSIVCRSSDVA